MKTLSFLRLANFFFTFWIYVLHLHFNINGNTFNLYSSESENSRYLDIYILIIYLNFSTFKDDKIINWGWSLLYIHPLVLQAAVCEDPWRGVGLTGCWHLHLASSEQVQHEQWPQMLCLHHVCALFEVCFYEGDNSFSMCFQSLASLLRLPTRMPISAIQKSPDMLW